LVAGTLVFLPMLASFYSENHAIIAACIRSFFKL
jgi:hypothetical protein